MSMLYKLLNLTVLAVILYAVGISFSSNGFKLPSFPKAKKGFAFHSAGKSGRSSCCTGSYGRSRRGCSSSGSIRKERKRMERYRRVFVH